MQLSLVKNIVISLSISEPENSEIDSVSEPEAKRQDIENEEGKAEFSFNTSFEKDNFFIIFSLNLMSHEKNNIKILYKSIFEADEEITDSFKESKFPFINAPAIAYPFLRAYLSTITINSGFLPIMLPSVNFVALWEEMQKEKKNTILE